MGWNSGYAIFEATVIGAYDLGVLDKKLLAVLMEPYRGTDIGSGGSRGLKAKDGKDVCRVVIETWGLKMPRKPKLPPNYAEWTPEEHQLYDLYQETVWARFRIVTDYFGWC